jgi:hypothetical protein
MTFGLWGGKLGKELSLPAGRASRGAIVSAPTRLIEKQSFLPDKPARGRDSPQKPEVKAAALRNSILPLLFLAVAFQEVELNLLADRAGS